MKGNLLIDLIKAIFKGIWKAAIFLLHSIFRIIAVVATEIAALLKSIT